MFEVLERLGTARVGARNGAVFGEEHDEFVVHALLLAFHVGGVDQELVAVPREVFERLGGNLDIDEGLPAVCRDFPARIRIFGVAHALAAQVEHQPFFAHRLR